MASPPWTRTSNLTEQNVGPASTADDISAGTRVDDISAPERLDAIACLPPPQITSVVNRSSVPPGDHVGDPLAVP
jgi:hypothetical protein